MKSRNWFMMAGLVSLVAGTGCTHEQVAQSTPQVTEGSQPPALSAENKTSLSPQPSEPAGKAVPSDRPFVSNDNLQPVYFEIGTSKLDDKAMETLKKNAEWLSQNTPFMIEVDGYADTRGSARRNHWVAEQRALQVRTYYASLGIPKNRILIKGIGEVQPTCAQMTEECLAQSRRSDTLVENKALASKP